MRIPEYRSSNTTDPLSLVGKKYCIVYLQTIVGLPLCRNKNSSWSSAWVCFLGIQKVPVALPLGGYYGLSALPLSIQTHKVWQKYTISHFIWRSRERRCRCTLWEATWKASPHMALWIILSQSYIRMGWTIHQRSDVWPDIFLQTLKVIRSV